ncbi:tripartite tricarboxylate transporter permease [Halorarum salinum]|uniref:Tripartite tricarboxylate transporter permease n=1 Tax=Halorarum salinum TaxID=2743089 RepID=A0A7D5L856_9EURY|nr:tripartite tricarboxylate transporter permease [Halobaculum salinum]QLG60308.1 tripartite tricarboxylate transporter permease [Halobaculum salinum]
MLLQQYFFEAVSVVLTPEFLLLIAAASIIGIFLGSMPGVGPALTLALAFPFTFAMEPEMGLMLMAVLYGSTTYGGSVSAILINVPGTPGSAATLLDGYPLTRQGKAALAIGIATISSFIGAVIGLGFLALFAPILAELALILGPPEMFLLAVLGLATVSAVSRGSIFKGFAAAGFGVVVASIGSDPITGQVRFTAGTYYLQGGIDLVVMLIGLFAVSQTIDMAVSEKGLAEKSLFEGTVWDGVRESLGHKSAIIRSSIIGSVVGAIPGAGITTANFLSYIFAVNLSDDPESFGTGNPEGVIAAEAANNGSTMGALIPAMALAIPGGASAAVFIGAMMSYGITPGPNAFEGILPYVIYVSILLGNVVFLAVGLTSAKYVARVTTIRHDVVMASILSIALIGAFAVRSNILDVGVAISIGVLGYLMGEYGYSIVGFVLGFILGPIAERGFQRSMLLADGDYMVFTESWISIVLLITTLILFFSPIAIRIRQMISRESYDIA